jgi:hypothetical protein
MGTSPGSRTSPVRVSFNVEGSFALPALLPLLLDGRKIVPHSQSPLDAVLAHAAFFAIGTYYIRPGQKSQKRRGKEILSAPCDTICGRNPTFLPSWSPGRPSSYRSGIGKRVVELFSEATSLRV